MDELERFEPEGDPDQSQADAIYILNGQGKSVRMEVPDDDNPAQ